MDSNYDEFGNYIGPSMSSDESVEDVIPGIPAAEAEDAEMTAEDFLAQEAQDGVNPMSMEVYGSAKDVYGDNVETLVHDADTQPLEVPIVAPVIEKKFDQVFTEPLETAFDWQFVSELAKGSPDSLRNVALVGNFHHGKTLISDLFVHAAHVAGAWDESQTGRGFLDYRGDERERLLSTKAVPFTSIVPDSRQKSWALTLVDTPGHPNFADEAVSAMQGVDNVAVVVDVLLGVERNTIKMIKAAITQGLPMILMINSLDRLILELKLPPTDAYHKIRHVLEQVNQVVRETNEQTGRSVGFFSPDKGNVTFSSGKFGFIFTVQSFAEIYRQDYERSNAQAMASRLGCRALQGLDARELGRRLWGDIYFNPSANRFQKSPRDAEENSLPRSFVEFILEPIWKIFATCVAEEKPTVEAVLEELGVRLPKSALTRSTSELLHQACKAYFPDSHSVFMDVLRDHGVSPVQAARGKLKSLYSGSLPPGSDFTEDLFSLAGDGYLVGHTFKNYHRPNCRQFDCLTRVYSGTLKVGETVRVLGPKYTPSNQEDSATRVVTGLWVFQGRYRVPITEAFPGQIVLVGGVDEAVVKTATLAGMEGKNGEAAPDLEVFSAPNFEGTAGAVKASCEPLKPSELPKMVRGLRCLERSYPLLSTRVEDSGEHVLYGAGELMMDCVLHDLRELYGELEVKVADPVVALQETVLEESAAMAYAVTPNGKNKITCVASPVAEPLVKAIDGRLIEKETLQDPVLRARCFQDRFGFNEIDAKAVWALGPLTSGSSAAGTCLLADETLPGSVPPAIKSEIKDYLMQGFQWIAREGPLIEEPVRQTKFRLTDLELADEAVHRGGGQVVPTARRAMYSAFLLAVPRLMEPIMFAEIVCTANAVQACFEVLSRRRGYVVKDQPKAGTPLFEVHAYIPAMDSFGFETDVRTHTSGQAMVLQFFDHWSVVPGDPLDRSILLRPLEPSPAPHLAREYTLKTRRRKGLTEDVQLSGITWEEA